MQQLELHQNTPPPIGNGHETRLPPALLKRDLLHQIEHPYVFPGETDVRTKLEKKDFVILTPFFEQWRNVDIDSPLANSTIRDTTINNFVWLHNLENVTGDREKDEGAKIAHNMLTNFLFSDSVLPCLTQIHEYGVMTGDQEARRSAFATMTVLNEAINVVKDYAVNEQHHDIKAFVDEEGRVNYAAAFAQMMSSDLSANQYYSTFSFLMKLARIQARQCLYANQGKNFSGILQTPGAEEFPGRVAQAIHEFSEAKKGIEIPESIRERLKSGKVSAIVISVDYNSTWNKNESFANTKLVSQVVSQISSLQHVVETDFPGTKLLVVLNTGRPARYAWGVLDNIDPIASIRRFALAESGGVVVRDIVHGRMEVAVDNPVEWKRQLDNLQDFLTGYIDEKSGLKNLGPVFEDKESMLSLQISPRHSNRQDWILTAKTGEWIDIPWLENKVGEFIASQKSKLSQRWREITEDVLASDSSLQKGLTALLKSAGPAGADGIEGTEDDLPLNAVAQVQKLFENHKNQHASELGQIQTSLQTLEEMKNDLEVNFNPTAGYADIKNKKLNKYSTLAREVEKELAKDGIKREDTLFIHIGDSTTDIMPAEDGPDAGLNEANRGADQVFAVGVADSTDDLKKSVAQRKACGYLTARSSVLGLIDTLEGMTYALMRTKEELRGLSRRKVLFDLDEQMGRMLSGDPVYQMW